MARINIEESWWSDPRRMRLALSLGNEYAADGVFFAAVRLAQRYWCNPDKPRQLIPGDAWVRAGLPLDLTKVELVERRGDEYYLRGSEEHFKWWLDKQEAGKKSAEVRRKKSGSAQPKRQTVVKQRSNTARTESEHLRTSSSISSSSSFSSSPSISDSFSLGSEAEKSLTEGQRTQKVIARYCELWEQRYQTPIRFSGKWAGNAKTLVRDHGLKESLRLVEAFLEMNDQWFLNKRHAFDLILTDLAKISHYAGTGTQVTRTQLQQYDRSASNAEAFRIAEERLAARRAAK